MLAARPEYKEGKERLSLQRNRIMTMDSSCLWRGCARRASRKSWFGFQLPVPGRACAQCPSTAFLSSQASGWPPNLWKTCLVLFPPPWLSRFAVSIQVWFFCFSLHADLRKIKATLTGPLIGPTKPIFWYVLSRWEKTLRGLFKIFYICKMGLYLWCPVCGSPCFRACWAESFIKSRTYLRVICLISF